LNREETKRLLRVKGSNYLYHLSEFDFIWRSILKGASGGRDMQDPDAAGYQRPSVPSLWVLLAGISV
jgi:hypothetical protein